MNAIQRLEVHSHSSFTGSICASKHSHLVEPEVEGQKSPHSNKWVFQINRKVNSEVDRYHARLVAKGFSQTKGIDFHKAFAILAKLLSIKLMLGVVIQVETTTSVMFD